MFTIPAVPCSVVNSQKVLLSLRVHGHKALQKNEVSKGREALTLTLKLALTLKIAPPKKIIFFFSSPSPNHNQYSLVCSLFFCIDRSPTRNSNSNNLTLTLTLHVTLGRERGGGGGLLQSESVFYSESASLSLTVFVL
jgi:hypothetical protein